MSTFETTRRKFIKTAGLFATAAAVPAAAWNARADAPETSPKSPATMSETHDSASDPFMWLEELDSEPSRKWVAAHNAETEKALCDGQFQRDRTAVLDMLNAPDRIPLISKTGRYVHNFWRDEHHPKGLWRRTTLASYRTPAPEWETVLDVDALAKAEGEDWVWHGCTTLPPAHRRGLVQLSRGGADALVFREFDLVEKRFVDAGFSLPEAKGSAVWIDDDTLLVASALGGEAFKTESGYARTVRRWKRGTPFAEAPVVFECDKTDLDVNAWRQHSPRYPRAGFTRQIDFFNQVLFVEDGGSLRKVDIPTDANADVERNWLVFDLRSDWEDAGRRYKAGSLLVADFDALLAGKRDFTVLFEPTPTRFLESYSAAGDVVAIQVLDNVQTRILFAHRKDGTLKGTGTWQVDPAAGLPGIGMETVSFQRLTSDDIDWADDRREAETYLIYTQSSITPLTMWLARAGENAEKVKQAPARFDAAGLTITQHHAVSVDGTKIPYFQVAPAGLALDGSHACLLTGYGGFEASELPSYSGSIGKLWLERGGLYVIANIRGGGEFGPAWHKAGMREGKKLSHDDFAAVARDLIARGVTKPARLACEGGSNGGLLVGNMLTRYPELFGAIECAVPLLDMKRYTKLAAGASWVGEYGDPDKPEDWAFIKGFSAYQNADPKRPYPPVLLTTSARDDRVHPGHARKMAAKLIEQGHKVYFHEPQDGGHSAGADNAQTAFNVALSFAFLRKTVPA
jgi:prolyl oligopeptidase